ncbi:MAG: AI-2E family transporter [Rickettsiales bacterium]|nr:AI-2E family transporter [Rickettsiales bacterium]
MILGAKFYLPLALLLILILCYSVSSILSPFIAGIVLAYLLNPITSYIENYTSRTIAAIISLLILIFLLVSVLFVIAPYLYQELAMFISDMPDYLRNLRSYLDPYVANFYNRFGLTGYEGNQGVLHRASQGLIKVSTGVLSNVLTSSLAFINVIALLIITPIVSFYLLRDWQGITKGFFDYIPRKHLRVTKKLCARIDRVLSGYIRGQLNVCFMLGVYYAIGLGFIGLNYGVLLGIVSGVLVILPYFGIAIGMVIGIILAYIQYSDITQVAIVMMVFLSGQFIEGNFITPKLVGDKVGLHPVVIIFALLSGATLFGFVGILFAIPFTASIWVLINHFLKLYKKSSSYK